ncbi:hypothetical protein BHM03_00009657, partial [Ensete ventricosum]
SNLDSMIIIETTMTWRSTPSTTPLSLSQSNTTTPILEEFPPLGDRDSRELPIDVLKLLAKALEKLSILRRNHFLLCLVQLVNQNLFICYKAFIGIMVFYIGPY